MNALTFDKMNVFFDTGFFNFEAGTGQHLRNVDGSPSVHSQRACPNPRNAAREGHEDDNLILQMLIQANPKFHISDKLLSCLGA